jgi:hypothetical protein
VGSECAKNGFLSSALRNICQLMPNLRLCERAKMKSDERCYKNCDTEWSRGVSDNFVDFASLKTSSCATSTFVLFKDSPYLLSGSQDFLTRQLDYKIPKCDLDIGPCLLRRPRNRI